MQQEHLKRQQDHILQQQHKIQELQNQISTQYGSTKGLPNLSSPQSLFLPSFLDQLRSSAVLMPPLTNPNKQTTVSILFYILKQVRYLNLETKVKIEHS